MLEVTAPCHPLMELSLASLAKFNDPSQTQATLLFGFLQTSHLYLLNFYVACLLIFCLLPKMRTESLSGHVHHFIPRSSLF